MFGIKILADDDYNKLVRRVEYAERRAETEKKMVEKYVKRNYQLFNELKETQKSLQEVNEMCDLYIEALAVQTRDKLQLDKEFQAYRTADMLMRG